ncbi:MAG TPA: IS110 family transposase [Solirubrobacteraceae bacterium]|nr:IS110 family transposase [Solirubrobacteraceae bacterium]
MSKLLSRPLGRCVGLDVHLDFIQIAICEEGKVWSAGRVPATPEGLETLVDSLLPTDRVALEVTGSSREIVRLLEPHVKKVVVVSPGDTGISQARAKTDKLDAKKLAKLLWTGELEAVWMPPEWISRMRRRLARREQLVRARSRVKNEIHAVLMRQLKGRAPASDLFGVKGRAWLRSLELPEEEDETVNAGLRHIEFLNQEIDQVDRLIAKDALQSPQIKRLMTVPGVNVICAAIFLATVGDIHRFKGSRPVVAYLGLDPRVYQSGSGPARGGRISKQGSPRARWALVEAARSVAQQPGPMHAFYERIRARKGHNAAVVAVARKLAVLFWCMLTREQDYAHQQPSLSELKLRRLEVAAGAPTRPGKPTGVWATRERMRHAEKQLAAQAEASYKRSIADWRATSPNKKSAGASVTAERA